MVPVSVLVCCVLMAAAAEAMISGSFTDKQGAKCKYMETRDLTRGMKVTCGRYNCEYRGNPHTCSWYNKNQPKFYACLAKVLEGAANACAPTSIACVKYCPDEVFRKQRVEYNLIDTESLEERDYY